MAAKATAINWQAMFNGAMASLDPTPDASARSKPIFQRKAVPTRQTAVGNDSVRERAFSNAAAALAQLWKVRK